MKKGLFFVFVFCMIYLYSCSQKIVFDGTQCSEIKDPKKVIEKTFRQQMKKFIPMSLEVNDEYIGYSKQSVKANGWTGGFGTVTNSNSIYFESIQKLELLKKKAHYEIRIYSIGKKRDIVFLKDLELAKQGYSAIKCMMESVKNK